LESTDSSLGRTPGKNQVGDDLVSLISILRHTLPLGILKKTKK